MPHLKDLDCSIELSESQRTLQEFGTTYGDGFVETFVPVPSRPQSFSIHLTSDKFIAPGISMYVFVDGVYQCNRNRQDLKLRKGSDSRSVVDFRVRQKEEKQKDGSMIAREWKFEKLDTVSADDAPDVCSSNILDNIGCIEVLVLRCAGPRTAKTVSSMNMDGAGDFPPQAFALDGQSDGRSIYDDRSPFFNGSASGSGPPPPVSSYHAPYAETAHSHDTKSRSHHSRDPPPFFSPYGKQSGSRFSEPIRPGARHPSIPSEAYQYGSGPIPAGPMMGSERSFYNTRPSSAVVANAPGVDPKWLNQVLTEAVKRGVEESRRADIAPAPTEQPVMPFDTQSQVPGAWPSSPYPPGAAPVQQFVQPQHKQEEVQDNWGGSQGWSGNQTATHVGWDTQSTAETWGPDETETDTWDTGEKHEKSGPEEQRSRQWSRSRAPTVHRGSETRPSASVTAHTHRSRQSKNDRTRKPRSKSRSRRSHRGPNPRSLSEDRDGWTYVEADLDTPTTAEFSDVTLQPSHSRSQYHGSRPRSRSRRRSHRTHSSHDKRRRSSRSHWHDGDRHSAGATPTIMNARSATHPPTIHSRRESNKFEYAPSVAPPPTTWALAPSEKSRRPSVGMTSVLPAPFSTLGKDFDIASEHDWKSPSPWDNMTNADKNEDSWAGGNTKHDAWGNEQSSWDTKDPPHKKDISTWDSDTANPPKETRKTTRNHTTPPKSSPPPQFSKRHTTKSLSKYRHLSSSTTPKSHWKFPPPNPSSPPSNTSPPPLKLSTAQASEKNLEHQVQLGKGTSYGHAISRPEYIDTLENPYAVFRFKYRSRAVLKGMFGDAVLERGHTSKKEKEKLKDVDKDELIDQMVRLKAKLDRGESEAGTEGVARGLTERWVEGQSREVSEKGRKVRKEKKRMEGGGDGWGEDEGEGGGAGWDTTW